MGAGLAYCL